MARVTDKQFAEQMREAEGEQGVPSDEELYSRFLPEETAPTEPVAEETPEGDVKVPVDVDEITVPETEVEKPLAGKYKTPEDLEKAYLELQRTFGSLSNEVGQLRQQQEQQATWQQQQQQQSAQQLPAGVSFDDILMQNPQQAVSWALQQNQPMLYEQAMQTWYEIDPRGAGRFERGLEMQQLQAQLQEQMQPQIQRGSEAANRAELEQAYQTVSGRHEDFNQAVAGLTPDNIGELWQGNAFVADMMRTALTQGSTQDKEAVYETLYAFAKAQQAGTLQNAALAAAQNAEQQARSDKQQASVASASTQTTTPPELSFEDAESKRLAELWRADDRSVHKGWSGKESRTGRR